MYGYPYFHSDDVVLNDAYRIAVGDLAGNVVPYRGGLLEKEEFCLLAGLDYTQPWTRDTAINVWYALAFTDSALCKNTLLSVLERADGKIRVAGSYGQSWDNVIWALGAYEYLLCHDDAEFLPFSLEVIANTPKKICSAGVRYMRTAWPPIPTISWRSWIKKGFSPSPPTACITGFISSAPNSPKGSVGPQTAISERRKRSKRR